MTNEAVIFFIITSGSFVVGPKIIFGWSNPVYIITSGNYVGPTLFFMVILSERSAPFRLPSL